MIYAVNYKRGGDIMGRDLACDRIMAKVWGDGDNGYKGYKAFQPAEVSWAETELVMVDEFREGNVPTSKDAIRVGKRL
jgi:hypothetical protein